MYLRTTKVKRPDGHVDEYIRLVESCGTTAAPVTESSAIWDARICWRLMPMRYCDVKRRPTQSTPRLEGGLRSMGLGTDAGGASLLAAIGTEGNYGWFD